MNYRNAFYYFTGDKNWLKKFVIGSIISIVPLLNLLAFGYMIRLIDSLREQESLPEWNDWKNLLINGFKLGAIYLLYGFVVILPLSYLFLALFVAVSPDFIELMPLPLRLTMFRMPGMVVIAFLIPVAIILFSQTKSFGSAYELKYISKVMGKYFNNILPIGIVIFFQYLITTIIYYFLPTSISFVLGGFIWFYALLIIGYLCFQFEKTFITKEGFSISDGLKRNFGYEELEKQNSCYNCGEILIGRNFCTSCGAPQNVCLSCHAERKGNARFCEECGQRFI